MPYFLICEADIVGVEETENELHSKFTEVTGARLIGGISGFRIEDSDGVDITALQTSDFHDEFEQRVIVDGREYFFTYLEEHYPYYYVHYVPARENGRVLSQTELYGFHNKDACMRALLHASPSLLSDSINREDMSDFVGLSFLPLPLLELALGARDSAEILSDEWECWEFGEFHRWIVNPLD